MDAKNSLLIPNRLILFQSYVEIIMNLIFLVIEIDIVRIYQVLLRHKSKRKVYCEFRSGLFFTSLNSHLFLWSNERKTQF